MKAFLLHDMPYADATHPLEEHAATAWVTYTNRHYDPATGQRLFDEYLQIFRTAEQLGFDGVAIPEYHQTPYSLSSSPWLTDKSGRGSFPCLARCAIT